MTVASPPRIIAETPAVARKKPGNLRATILAVVAWQVVALLFVEGILYWSGLGEEDIYKMDKSVGFRHFPNKRVTWRSEGYSVSYFDADGMREPGLKIEKPAGVYRIALLGDSMVEGLQVPIEQTFGKLVEKRLNGESNRSVEILNFANSGYSTVQEYLLLKEKVFKYHPDLVVLGYMNRDMFEKLDRTGRDNHQCTSGCAAASGSTAGDRQFKCEKVDEISALPVSHQHQLVATKQSHMGIGIIHDDAAQQHGSIL